MGDKYIIKKIFAKEIRNVLSYRRRKTYYFIKYIFYNNIK